MCGCEKMQPDSVTEFQQLWGSWTNLLNRLYEDPKVSQLMNTRIGLYLSTHPSLALTVLMFSAIAALPVGLFLTFALVTIIMSAAGFVFFEGFLLFVGGLALLCVLSGIALFSLVASSIFRVVSITVSKILSQPHLTESLQQSKTQGTESETSKLEEMQ